MPDATPSSPGPHCGATGAPAPPEAAEVVVRRHPGGAGAPTLVYLPGLHGDWTLVGPFRRALAGRADFVELTYPRTTVWSLADYARAVDQALARAGVGHGWLLAESFGSQVAWAVIADTARQLQIQGLIVAGGFVRYRGRWLVRLSERVVRRVSVRRLQQAVGLYAWLVRRTRYRDPAFWADLDACVARRTELDRQAAAHRMRLITEADWRAVAAGVRFPVFHLSALFDPVVPPWPVRRWLQAQCPGFRASRIVGFADHNVLGSAPSVAAEQVIAWIRQA